MRICVVRPGELGPSDIASWHSMQFSTPSFANPFLSPEFAIAVGKFRPGARVAVLSDGQSTVGFFPFEQRMFGAGVPIAAGLTDCQGLIHAPGVQWDARELLRACQLSVWKFDHLVDGQHPFENYRVATLPSPVIDLSGGFGSYYEKLGIRSPQFCRNLERKIRKLARDAGELRFVPDSGDGSAFRALMAWKSAQYRRTAQADIFARPWVARITEALFSTHSSYFSGLLSVLYAGDVPVAAHFGIRFAHILAHWFPAYDTAFSRYSPGLILHIRMAEFTPGIGVRIIDMGTGVQRYKEELKTGDIFVGGGIVTGQSPLAAARRMQGIWGQWAINTIKQHPRVFAATDWLRKQYRLARNAQKRGAQKRSS
jgi:CelD/BcsL family acetyltransferase involved in cellulose biosynthesis